MTGLSTSGLMLTCLPELELADRRLPGELGLLKLFGRSSTRSGLPLGAARLMRRPARLLRLRSSDKLLCVPCKSSREVRLLLGRPAEGISKGACSLQAHHLESAFTVSTQACMHSGKRGWGTKTARAASTVHLHASR